MAQRLQLLFVAMNASSAYISPGVSTCINPSLVQQPLR